MSAEDGRPAKITVKPTVLRNWPYRDGYQSRVAQVLEHPFGFSFLAHAEAKPEFHETRDDADKAMDAFMAARKAKS